jgi:hypothetical protein
VATHCVPLSSFFSVRSVFSVCFFSAATAALRLGANFPACAVGFDHISRNPPVLIRTPKLTRLEPAQYWGGGPPGNSVVLNPFCFFFLLLPTPPLTSIGTPPLPAFFFGNSQHGNTATWQHGSTSPLHHNNKMKLY